MAESTKIFVTGFFNSGKTTLIHTLDDKAISVEKKLAEEYEPGKTHTTTGFDLGRLVWARPNLNRETVGVIMSKTEYLRDINEYSGWYTKNVEMKGSPGQTQFKTVRKILAKGCDGVIMLIDGCDLANIGNALVILEEIKLNFGPNIPLRIIANKSDREDYFGAEMISDMIGDTVYEGSAKDNIGIKDAVIEVLKLINSNSENVQSKGEAVV
jgi:signal recognition particle receptor subunit beta